MDRMAPVRGASAGAAMTPREQELTDALLRLHQRMNQVRCEMAERLRQIAVEMEELTVEPER